MLNEAVMLPLECIFIGERFREDFGDIESLAQNINQKGLYHAIVVEPYEDTAFPIYKYRLIAGERRIKAHQFLNRTEIRATLWANVDEITRKEIEAEENIFRHNFSWIEEVKIKLQLHRIKRAKYGSAVKGHKTDKGWSQADTAEALGESTTVVSGDLKLAEALAEFPELLEEKTKTGAQKRLGRLMENLLRAALSSKMVIPIELDCITKGDARTLILLEKSESYDLVFTDPPYGVGINKSGETKRVWGNETFNDNDVDAMELLNSLAPELFRVLKKDTNAYFFFAMSFYEEVKKILEDAGFSVCPTPIIWNKESWAAPPTTPYMYASCYEPCFLCSKGVRQLNGYLPNVLTYPRVPTKQKIHPTQKPVAMIQRMIEASCNAGDKILDPFGGSGSTLVAAFKSKRKPTGFEKDDVSYNACRGWLESLKGNDKEEELEEVTNE